MSGLRRAAVAMGMAVALTGVTVPGSTATASAPAPAPARATASCPTPTAAFKPRKMTIKAIDRTVKVIRVPRTASGAVGSPPVTKQGKWLMGRDPQVLPGSGEGTVIMTAHTWPDNSALGNALLRSLKAGGRLKLTNAKGSKVACYQVSKRKRYRANKVPRTKAFRWWGPEQLVIVVCSGKRLGPGRWTHRTIWYATPFTDEAPAE